MAGKITISTLNNDTGVLATQNGMTGIAKAWVFFNGGTNGTTAGTIVGSFNVSSITVTTAGQYVVNYTTALTSSAQAVVVGASPNFGVAVPIVVAYDNGSALSYSTSAAYVSIRSTGSTLISNAGVSVVVFGN